MSFDLTTIKQMEAYANFGKAVIELAKDMEIIPKRQQRRVVTRVKTRIVVRKPRRTAAQMANDSIGTGGVTS